MKPRYFSLIPFDIHKIIMTINDFIRTVKFIIENTRQLIISCLHSCMTLINSETGTNKTEKKTMRFALLILRIFCIAQIAGWSLTGRVQ